jgi:hypothetical protein
MKTQRKLNGKTLKSVSSGVKSSPRLSQAFSWPAIEPVANSAKLQTTNAIHRPNQKKIILTFRRWSPSKWTPCPPKAQPTAAGTHILNSHIAANSASVPIPHSIFRATMTTLSGSVLARPPDLVLVGFKPGFLRGACLLSTGRAVGCVWSVCLAPGAGLPSIHLTTWPRPLAAVANVAIAAATCSTVVPAPRNLAGDRKTQRSIRVSAMQARSPVLAYHWPHHRVLSMLALSRNP